MLREKSSKFFVVVLVAVLWVSLVTDFRFWSLGFGKSESKIQKSKSSYSFIELLGCFVAVGVWGSFWVSGVKSMLSAERKSSEFLQQFSMKLWYRSIFSGQFFSENNGSKKSRL